MGRIIAICNQKGGTGKTTSAVNIGAALSIAGKSVLLVDMDPQGNASSGVGIEREEKLSIYEVLTGEASAAQAIYPTKWANLSVLPSNMALTGSEIELVNVPGREQLLGKALSAVKNDFSFVLIDAPPSLGLLTLNVLAAADGVIVPVQCEYFALEGVSNLLNTIELVKERLNARLTVDGVLLTMGDFRTRLTLQVIDEIRGHFKEKAFNTVIPRNIKLAEAPSFGQPIQAYDSACVGAKAYMALAQEILGEKIEAAEMELKPENISVTPSQQTSYEH